MTRLGKIIFGAIGGVILVVLVLGTLHYWPSGTKSAKTEEPGSEERVVWQKGGTDSTSADEAAKTGDENVGETGRQDENKDEQKVEPRPLGVTTERAKTLLEKAKQLEKEGQIIAARDACNDALKEGLNSKDAASVKASLAKLNDKILFSSRLVPGDADCKMYRIQSGDSLTAIAQRFCITVEAIKRVNGLASDMIYADHSLKVIQGPFDVRVYKGEFELEVWLRDKFVKAYPIAVGKGDLTPEGKFAVAVKLRNPPYQPRHKPRSAWRGPDDPDNPLGERWIGFDGDRGLGIHGTIEPESIGKKVSDGCIRMFEKDVEELYDLLAVGVSRVTIYP